MQGFGSGQDDSTMMFLEHSNRVQCLRRQKGQRKKVFQARFGEQTRTLLTSDFGEPADNSNWMGAELHSEAARFVFFEKPRSRHNSKRQLRGLVHHFVVWAQKMRTVHKTQQIAHRVRIAHFQPTVHSAQRQADAVSTQMSKANLLVFLTVFEKEKEREKKKKEKKKKRNNNKVFLRQPFWLSNSATKARGSCNAILLSLLKR
jgi:hypothetical protein